jgi:hypothetical protein
MNNRERAFRKKRIIQYTLALIVLSSSAWFLPNNELIALVWFLIGYFLAEARKIIFKRVFYVRTGAL